MTTLLFSHPSAAEHDTGHGHPERADRIRAVLEALDAPTGVHQLLLAREERVAGAAQLHVQLRHGGLGREAVAAGAGTGRLAVLGVDVWLHESPWCAGRF